MNSKLIEVVNVLASKHKDTVEYVGNKIWQFAELSGVEYNSAHLLISLLKDKGFHVEQGIADYPTSFIGTYSSGNGTGPTVGLLCEYDALPGLSTVTEDGNGHGCGHNLFAAGAIGTALTLMDYISQHNHNLVIKVFGTPSEEKNGSKPYMAKQGYFDNVDVFMGFHPLEFNGVLYKRHNAITIKKYQFHGEASHAGAEPELGRSALDAVELMNVGVNYLREHVTSDVRMHYIITHGGRAANIVPDFAESEYVIRAQEADKLKSVIKRIDNIAKGAGLMTDCSCEHKILDTFSNTIVNKPLSKIAQKYIELFGAPDFEEAEVALSKKFGDGNGLCLNIEPLPSEIGTYTASTDEGDVSWQGPWVRVCQAVFSDQTPGHSKEVTEQANLPYAYKAVMNNIKICVATLLNVVLDDDVLVAVKDDFKNSMKNKSYDRNYKKIVDTKRFPNIPGVSVKGNSLTIEKENIAFIREIENLEIKIFSDGEVLYSGVYNNTVQLKRLLENKEQLTIFYKEAGTSKIILLGYYQKED